MIQKIKHTLSRLTTTLILPLDNIAEVTFPPSTTNRIMDYNSDEDVRLWCQLVNEAYGEKQYDLESARALLMNHPSLVDNETILLFENDLLIGTVTNGVYRENRQVGGGCRFAMRKEYRGRGWGGILLAYYYRRLYERGCVRAESQIRLNRVVSLNANFKMGCVPMDVRKRVVKNGHNPVVDYLLSMYINAKTNALYREYKASASLRK